jgi:hypothetical protein
MTATPACRGRANFGSRPSPIVVFHRRVDVEGRVAIDGRNSNARAI